MNNLRDDLLTSYKAGTFLVTVHANSLTDDDSRRALSSELVALHNERLIDVVDAFESLENNPSNGPDFFLTRHVFEEVLPDLDAPTPSVMRCVLHLYRDAGQDMAAGIIFESFINFCVKAPARSREALREIEKHPDAFMDLLSATISAGSRLDNAYYLAEVIRLSESDNIELRRRAVFSVGKLHWQDNVTLLSSAFLSLERSVTTETDDQILASIIKSAFALFQRDRTHEFRAIALVTNALSKGDELALHAASELFGFNMRELPDSLLDALLVHLMRIKPKNNRSLGNVDYGISHLLKSTDPEKAIRFLEDYLLAHPDELTLKIFDSAAHQIRSDSALISKVLTRWFLRGDRVLCEGIHTIVGAHHGDNLRLEVDPSELTPADFIHIVLLARKAIGYLFFYPVSAASVLVSLMRHAPSDKTLAVLGGLLFDPLLLNFTGRAREYLAQQSEFESEKIKETIGNALRAIDEYLNALNTIGDLSALHPGEAQREAHHRHISRIMAESYKAAQAQSVLLNLFSKSVLLYGKKSIDYVYGLDGKPNRIETPLRSHGVAMELPRMEYFDPFELDYMLRVFRNEKLQT